MTRQRTALTKQQRDAFIIQERLGHYDSGQMDKLRDRLVEQWREVYPDAAKETSSVLKPLIRMEMPIKTNPSEPDEIWYNDTYNVTVRRHKKDPVFYSKKGMIQLGISSHDGTSRHDWRDFQAIKNQLAGPECEAFELYPAESRLLDPSNYYSLWCFPSVNQLNIGHGADHREVRDAGEALAPQRAFPKEANATE